MIVHNIPF